MPDILTDREPTQAAPTGPSYGDVATKLEPINKERAKVQEQIAESYKAEAADLHPKMREAQEAGQRLIREMEERSASAMAASRNVREVQFAQPSRGLRPFLAPVNGEAPESTIAKLTQALGIFGAAVAGSTRGDARAGLAALTGAMKGWQEGDRERADRHYADWRSSMDAALSASEEERRSYRQWFENANLTVDQQYKGIEMEARMRGNERMALLAQQHNLDTIAADLFKWHQSDMQVEHWGKQLDAQKNEADERHKIERERIKVQQAEVAARLADVQQRREEQLGQAAHGMYYDPAKGVRQISKREQIEELQRVAAGGKPMLREMAPAQVQLLERLAVAPPILDRLDQLIDQITAAAPGQNITQGLINKLRLKAGIGPAIQEMVTLRLDSALENAAALSGGQPRITILRMLRDEASPKESMTTEVAKRTNNTTRTTIINRMASATGDPNAYKTLSQDLLPYKPPESLGTMRIRRIGDTSGKVYEGPSGEVPAGYEKAP